VIPPVSSGSPEDLRERGHGLGRRPSRVMQKVAIPAALIALIGCLSVAAAAQPSEHEVIRAYRRATARWLSAAGRRRMDAIRSEGTVAEHACVFGFVAADYALRDIAPRALEANRCLEAAATLRSLAPVVDDATAYSAAREAGRASLRCSCRRQRAVERVLDHAASAAEHASSHARLMRWSLRAERPHPGEAQAVERARAQGQQPREIPELRSRFERAERTANREVVLALESADAAARAALQAGAPRVEVERTVLTILRALLEPRDDRAPERDCPNLARQWWRANAP